MRAISVSVLAAIVSWTAEVAADCKCIPGQDCWPSDQTWSQFGESLDGDLIDTEPLALPCYEGDDGVCETVRAGWSSSGFRAAHPLGYAYPVNESCSLPGVNETLPLADCRLGSWPVYAVNVTSEEDISKSILFAAENNLRVVVKSTGHDFLQRSTGFGSLSIWLHNFRQGFEFFDDNSPVLDECPSTAWNGSTLSIHGVYAWSDLYPTAREKGVVLVGGSNNGPSSTGGWVQGGGHSPVSRYHGIGADQVLSARVVLASGEIVTASHCENQELFFAIRGGGGGTYGVVTQMTVKTHPTRQVHVANLLIGSNGEETVPGYLDAVTEVYSSLPSLSKDGFAGYAIWYAHLAVAGVDYSNQYSQAFIRLGGDLQEAQSLFGDFEENILQHSDAEAGIDVSISWLSFEDYGTYFDAKNDTEARVGGITALSSRLLDTEALTNVELRSSIELFAGVEGAPIYHTVVHHGLEAAEDVSPDPTSAVQPGWYNSILLDIFEMEVLGFDVADNAAVFADLRERVTPAYRELSPSTGTYMNEADWGDNGYQTDFYGIHFEALNEAKATYDPEGVFYCPTCIGSDGWAVSENGALCRQ